MCARSSIMWTKMYTRRVKLWLFVDRMNKLLNSLRNLFFSYFLSTYMERWSKQKLFHDDRYGEWELIIFFFNLFFHFTVSRSRSRRRVKSCADSEDRRQKHLHDAEKMSFSVLSASEEVGEIRTHSRSLIMRESSVVNLILKLHESSMGDVT